MSVFVRSEADVLQQVVVAPPRREYFRVEDKARHNITETADEETAVLQHRQLVAVMGAFGAEVLSLAELPGHPNSVFTRDTAVVTPRGFIKLRMGLASRRGEAAWMAVFLESRGVPCVGTIVSSATAEGGDVILAGDVAFVGRSGRTNDAGVQQVSGLLRAQGYEVRVADVPARFLHIGGAMSVIDTQTVLSVAGVFPEGFFAGFLNLSVPNDGFIGGNVITLGPREVVALSESSAVGRLLREHDFTVHAMDLGEFSKGTGGPSCLIMPLVRKS